MKKWRVQYGIHRGTLMSRDSTGEEFESEQEARDFLKKIVSGYQPGVDRFGYVLWFATLWSPEDKQVQQINGYPYV